MTTSRADPLSLSLAFTAVAFLAVLWPARRAAAVDPLVVRKDESDRPGWCPSFDAGQ